MQRSPQTVKNLVEFAPAGDSHHVVPPRGIAASACAKKVPQALFLNAAASDKTRYARQVWNLCAKCAQIMRAVGCSLFKREPSPRGSRLRACQKDFLTSSNRAAHLGGAALCVIRSSVQRQDLSSPQDATESVPQGRSAASKCRPAPPLPPQEAPRRARQCRSGAARGR